MGLGSPAPYPSYLSNQRQPHREAIPQTFRRLPVNSLASKQTPEPAESVGSACPSTVTITSFSGGFLNNCVRTCQGNKEPLQDAPPPASHHLTSITCKHSLGNNQLLQYTVSGNKLPLAPAGLLTHHLVCEMTVIKSPGEPAVDWPYVLYRSRGTVSALHGGPPDDEKRARGEKEKRKQTQA